MDRRTFIEAAVAGATAFALPRRVWAEAKELEGVRAQIAKKHAEAVQRLQEWIRQPSIAAENRGVGEGCDMMMRLLRDAGFGQVLAHGEPCLTAANNDRIYLLDRQFCAPV